MMPETTVANFNAGKMNGNTVPINIAGIIAAGTPNCSKISPGRIFLPRPVPCVSAHVFAVSNGEEKTKLKFPDWKFE